MSIDSTGLWFDFITEKQFLNSFRKGLVDFIDLKVIPIDTKLEVTVTDYHTGTVQ